MNRAKAGALSLPFVSEARVRRAIRPLTDHWRHIPVAPRGSTLLGLSFRPLQADALGLDAQATLSALLDHPFRLIRLGAYWDRIEPAPGVFSPDALDWQIDAAERAGKQVILNVGALKSFGYPEYFAPAHTLSHPLREGALVTPTAQPSLLAAATAFVARIVERYRSRPSIVAWQVEQDAVDPLGLEHSWRLSAAFVQQEVAAVRAADPTRPVMLNGFLPTSSLVRLQQWFRTRDQGDSLAVAQRLADIVGVDYYPRHALFRVGARTVYLEGNVRRQRRWGRLLAWAAAHGRRVMISEGQAEPWETVTTPPSPQGQEMYSCPPEQVITNYNDCAGWAGGPDASSLYAYLFWGAEYWVRRARDGDASYLQAFARILEQA
jgi:hypothetical protein